MAGESRNRHSGGGDEGVVTSGLSSRSSFLIPKRNGFVSVGESCILKTNHFKPLTHWDNLHLYDVSIKVMSCGVNRATSCVVNRPTSYGVNRAVMRQLCKKYRQSHLCDRLPAYDGRNRLYSYGPFSFVSETFVIALQDEEDSLDGGQAPQRYGTLFDVMITFNAILTGAIDTEESIQALSTVLRESPIERCFRVGRSFYSPSSEKRHLLGGGLKIWCGFYQSIQHCQMGLSLTIDTSYKAFIEPQPVIEFVDQLLSRKTSDGPLSGDERLKIIKALHGVKVYVTHRGNVRTKYRISGLASKVTSKLSFPVDNHGTRKTVVQYFQEKYGYVIKHISLPCLQVGNQQRPNYLPIEVCKIAEGQHYREQLNENQLSAFLEVTCQRPIEREQDILKTLKSHNEDAYLKEFGITFDNNLTTVEGRVLPPPYLKFHEGEFLPKVGRWDMRRKKMFKGGVVDSWACINFAWDINDDYALNFCNELVLMCHVSGMEFSTDPVLPVAACNPKFVELALKEHYKRAMNILGPLGKKLDLLILILPDNNGTLYGEIKRILETDIGLVSQCCLAKHVFIPKKQYLANIVLKINVKVGGKNTVLLDALEMKLPRVSNKPTIIFGADVSHPHPREGCSSPSIAAVVASQDWPQITKYAGLVSPQTNRGEIINDLFNEKTGGMVRKHLISFYRETGYKPGRIIFYRDGVSKGQLNQVLDHELAAIKKACASLEPTYNPQVTFVVVQKRHHTRLFSHDYDVGNTVYLSGNVLPGTVIDKEICHPTDFDFYLCSHAGTKGVSRPILYHVLCDENNFTANALQTLTYQLCYTYARCTSSVSIVPPVYYAHLLASRGRFYIKPEQRTECLKKKGGQRAEISFPDIKENVKDRGMFFC